MSCRYFWLAGLILWFHCETSAIPAVRVDLKCATRTNQIEAHKFVTNAVLDESEKVEAEEISIRQSPSDPPGKPDQRTECKEKWCRATQKVFCAGNGEPEFLIGSANVIGPTNVMTIGHVLIDKENCVAITRNLRCYLKINKKNYDLKFSENFYENMCRIQKGKDEDFNLMASTSEPIKGIDPYKTLSLEEAKNISSDDIMVIGAYATNSRIKPSETSRQLVSKGKIFRIDPRNNVIEYDNDTGSGSSGGGLIVKIQDEHYYIGSHRGDGDDSIPDGQVSAPGTNYGTGILYFTPKK